MNVQSARDLSAGDFRSWGLPAWDFDLFHREELPNRIATGAGAEVAWDLLGAPPIAIALPDGRAFSYISRDGSVAIEPGVRDEAACVLEMPEEAWQAHVHEFRTVTGLILSQSVRFLRGDMDSWDIWAPALRRLYSGNPIYNPDAVLLDSKGDPLDLNRRFTLADDDAEMSDFLNTAGFIVVRGAMAHLRNQIADEVDRLRAEAREGNIYSWWVNNETTKERFPYRLLYVSELSKLIRSLMDENPIVKRLAALTRAPLAPVHDRLEGALCVLKPFKAGEELSPSIAGNLHWHADCGMGGCPVTCPAINIGIHVDAAGPESSQFWALAGSQRRSIHDHFKRGIDWRNAIALDTNPGDVTVHFTCMQHAGPPPTGDNGRRTLYLPFYAPATLRLFGRYQGFQQLLPGFGTGEIPSVTAVAKELI